MSQHKKNEVATRKWAKWWQNSVTTDFLGRDRDANNTRQCCNKNQNRNAIPTRKVGSRHQFEEAAQHHYRYQENTVVTEIKEELGNRSRHTNPSCNRNLQQNSKLCHDRTFRSRLRRQYGPKIHGFINTHRSEGLNFWGLYKSKRIRKAMQSSLVL